MGLILQAARLVGKWKAEGTVTHMPRALRKTLRAQGACMHCELFLFSGGGETRPHLKVLTLTRS